MALIIPDVKMDFKELISKFAIPTDIKQDLVYCQKKIVQYLKLHKILSIRAQASQNRMKELALRKSLDEIEKEICEISRDQKLLVARLREYLEEYYNTLKRESIEIDRDLGNAYVAQQLSRHIDSSNTRYKPFNIKTRNTKKELLIKYGIVTEMQSNSHDEDEKKYIEPVELIRVSPPGFTMNTKQVSLLKPKAERFALQRPYSNNPYHVDVKDIKEININGNNLPTGNVNISKPPSSVQGPTRNIRSSRLNLLQALNKAKNQSLGMAAKHQQAPFGDKLSDIATSSQSSQSSQSSVSSASRSSSSPTNSDDCLDAAPVNSPAYSDEHKSLDLIVNDKETFLRQFDLYTHEHCRVLSQRRSKRRRRNVQNNEKSDYHYGNLDLFDRMDKKKKTFLNSPPATRSLKRKKAEVDTNDVPTTSKTIVLDDRSSSSSPDQQYLCNECFKSGEEILLQCINCNGPFHVKCHRGSISKIPIRLRSKLCPACLRNRNKDTNAEVQYQLRDKAVREQMKLENLRLKTNRESLWKNFVKFDEKISNYRVNQGKLLKDGESLKSEMINYINIVDDFKFKL